MPTLPGLVTRVIDGATIDVRLASGPIRVRLHAIDTPERGHLVGLAATFVSAINQWQEAMLRSRVHARCELVATDMDIHFRMILLNGMET